MRHRDILALSLALLLSACASGRQLSAGDKTETHLEVDGQLWRRVVNFEDSGPSDHHYVVRVDSDGRTAIVFGDGKHGARLPTGTRNITATYRSRRGRGKADLEVDGQLWRRVVNFENSGPSDCHYVVREDSDGRVTILFGDGAHGARLPSKGRNGKFDPRKHYVSVQLEQGDPLLDQDWNEGQNRLSRFCGLYRGIVLDNTDPRSLLRLQVRVPAVLGDLEIWALPCIPAGGSSGVPDVGKGIWVMFEGGNPAYPVWIGTMYYHSRALF